MWNALKRFLRTFDEQGRTRFAALASDSERALATASTAGIGAATCVALLATLYFVLYLVLAFIYLREYIGDPRLWLMLYYYSLLFGVVQGSLIGGVLGWGLALSWQGKRSKAATTCLAGGAISIVLMALFQAQYYDPAIPPDLYIFWALILFSPGYLTATSVAAWGLNLLSTEK